MEFVTQPWQHQLDCIEKARAHDDFALFLEMGTGKSGTLINILREKFNTSKRVMRTLILCPPIVIKNWGEEWQKHSKMPRDRVVLLTGPGKSRVKKFMAKAYDKEYNKEGLIFVTNYEGLLMPDLFEQFTGWQPEVLVLDESHKCKDASTKRAKAAIKLSAGAQHRYILSGSPVLNSPMDLFSQFLILDQGATFGKNFYTFRARFFRDRNAGMPRDRYFPDWQILPGSLEEINRLIYTKGMRVTKEEAMPHLPPLVRETLRVGLSELQARMYKEMKRDLVTYLKGHVIMAQLAMTKAMRLQQIASGYAMSEDGKEVTLGQTPRQDALKELLEQLTPNHKVLVWAVWKENYAQIRTVCEELGVAFVEVHGDVGTQDKFANVDRFNTDPTCRVLIGHPGSGGIGINLVAASYSIFYSRSFSLDHYKQAEARNHRGGSEIHEKITRIDLVAENTIDELVAERLANKIEVSDTILRDLSQLIQEQEY